MNPSEPVVSADDDGLEDMTVEVRQDSEGGCVVDIGGDGALATLEAHAREDGISVEQLVLTVVGNELRRRREVR